RGAGRRPATPVARRVRGGAGRAGRALGLARLQRRALGRRGKRGVELLVVARREGDVKGAAVLANVRDVGALRDRNDPVSSDAPVARDLPRRLILVLATP